MSDGTHATHGGTSSTLARHPRNPRWYITLSSKPPMLAHHPLEHATDATHAATLPTLAPYPR